MAAIPNFFLNKEDFGKMGNSDRYSSPSNTYRAKDGFIHIMAGSDDRFKALLMAMKMPKLFKNAMYNDTKKRIKNQDKLDEIVEEWTKSKNISYLGKILQKFSVPWGKVRSFSEFLQTKEGKQYLRKADIKNKKITVPKLSINLPHKKDVFKKKVPELGQDNIEILENLGFNKKKIYLLKKNKII